MAPVRFNTSTFKTEANTIFDTIDIFIALYYHILDGLTGDTFIFYMYGAQV